MRIKEVIEVEKETVEIEKEVRRIEEEVVLLGLRSCLCWT